MRRSVEPLRREVEVPRNRWAMPTCPVVAMAAVLMLSWVSALSAPSATPAVERVRPCPERRIETHRVEPTPAATEYECEFGELLDCNYGGRER